ncbi:MAG: hypothetical protein P8K79_06275 [Mariniblastus sp.]|nr:hypothetical protein [Mariniblastus sp.]
MWKCKKCCEEMEDALTACWSCGTTMEGVEDPSFRRSGPPGEEALVQEQANQPPCCKCGASKVLPGLKVVDRNYVETSQGPLTLYFHKPTGGVNLSGGAAIQAAVCGACGHVELSVGQAQAESLWSAFEEFRQT